MNDIEQLLADQVEAYLAGQRKPYRAKVCGELLFVLGDISGDNVAGIEHATGRRVVAVMPHICGTVIFWRAA
jgi:hypothetical protein